MKENLAKERSEKRSRLKIGLQWMRRHASFCTMILLMLISLEVMLNIRPWKRAGKDGRIISWDVTSYYGYLPAYFIHHDLSLDFIDGNEQYYHDTQRFWPEYTASGKKVIKTTLGMSMAYAPFFLIAHWDTLRAGNYEADGFTTPYELALAWSCLFYFLIGLYFLRKLLRLSFDEWTVACTMIGIYLGTNLFYYTSTQPCMSHAYLFSAMCGYLYAGIRWKQSGLWKYAITMGLLAGWMCLTRPTMFFLCLAPFLYMQRSFKEEVEFLRKHWLQILLMAFCALLVIFPQVWYWKTVTDHWLYLSYGEERFYFLNPHISDFLFSYRKGWFLYTPIMFFTCFGFMTLYKRQRGLFWMSMLPILALIYVNSSWWCWWYGGSFGQRAMVESYVLMAIPLASLIQCVKHRSNSTFVIAGVLLGMCMGLNLFQSHQARRGLIHWDSMTKESYWDVFLNMEPKNYRQSLRQPDYDHAKKGLEEFE